MKYVIFTLFAIFCSSIVSGQSSWTLSNAGIEQGFNVSCFTITQSGDVIAIGTKIVTTPTYTSTPAIYKSTNSGNNWTKINTTGLTNHNYLYIGICAINNILLLSATNDSQGYAVYKSSDNGVSWTLSNTGIEQGFNVSDFTITPSGNIFAVGTKIVTTPTYTSTPAIYKSTNSGNNWTKISTTGLTVHNYLYLGVISINNILLLSATNDSQGYAVYKSSDNGMSWTLSNTGIEQGFNVSDFTITPNGNILAVGTKILTTPTYTSIPAIYKSTDNGNNWTKINTTGLTNHNYLYIGICAINNILLLSATNDSQGYAVYSSQSTTGIIEESKITNLDIYPNPTSDILYITNILPTNHIENIYIFDINGMIQQSTKLNSNSLDISNLPAGTYIARFIVENRILNLRFIIN